MRSWKNCNAEAFYQGAVPSRAWHSCMVMRLLARLGQAGETLIPWFDQPSPVPPPAAGIIRTQTRWEDLDSWITPNGKFFSVGHYNWPEIDEKTWRLDVDGLVTRPASLSLSALKAMPRQEITSTIECSGNNGLPFLTSAVGNARWAGTSLAGILKAAQIKTSAIEVVFFARTRARRCCAKTRRLNSNSPVISHAACR